MAFNIVDFVIDVFELVVVNHKTVLVVVDGFVEHLEDILDFGSHSLASWGGKEFVVESIEISHFLGFTPSLEGSTSVSDWLRLLNRFPGLLNIVHLLANNFLTGWGNLDLDHALDVIKVFLIIRGVEVGDLKVLLDGHLEVYHLLLECFALSGGLEFLHSSLDGLSLLGGEGSIHSNFVSLVPLGSIKGFEFVSNIFELVSKVINIV